MSGKRFGILMLAALLAGPGAARAAGIVGVDAGVLLPTEELDDAMDKGGVLSPYVAYMANDYLGFMTQAQVWGAWSEDRPNSNDTTAGAVGLMAGPRLALPLGPVELYTTGQGGIFTALSDEVLTDTSWAVSAGAGVNFFMNRNWFVGISGRWNRLYQRVHGTGDAEYITANVGFGYEWGQKEPALEMMPAPEVRVQEERKTTVTPPVKRKIVLRGVNFDFDKHNIRSDARPILDEAVSTLKEQGGIAVVAEGHTDWMGTDQYNEKLSMRRANSVKDYMVTGGISESRVSVEGYGETRPVATNETDDGRAQNRRVELRVIDR